MADLSLLRSRVQLHVANCPYLVIDQALSDAAREWCRDTLAWQIERDVLVEPGVASYLIPQLGGVQLVQAIELRRPNQVRPLLYEVDHKLLAHKRVGAPRRWAVKAGDIVLDALPEAAESLTLTFAVRPGLGSSALDDTVLNSADKALVAAAVATVKSQPRQPWTDPNGALYHRQIFDGEVVEQRNVMARGHIAGSLRVKPRRWV